MKLKDGEAQSLADFLLLIGRPRGPQQEAQLLAWVKRLQGGR